MTKWIYSQPIPEWAPNRTDAKTQREASLQTALQGNATAESVGLQPGTGTLKGSYVGEDADWLALELRELADAPDIEAVPVHDDAGDPGFEGYYVLDSVDAGPPQPQAQARLQGYTIEFRKTGTRRTRWRSVATSKDSRSNDFGSDQVTEIAVPAQASQVRWWDGDADLEYPMPTETRTSEHRDLEVYDVDAAAFDDPTLLFSIPYSEEGRADCVVWDERGLGDKLGGDAYGQSGYGEGGYGEGSSAVDWGRVFAPAHEFVGKVVLSSRRLRLTIDDTAGSITAEQWDEGLNTWTDVSLGSSSWEPVDVDIRTISPARLKARILFSDGSSRYPLDAILSRGGDKVLFARTPNATSETPQGLIDLLDPIAATTIYDAQASQGLVAREDVEQ